MFAMAIGANRRVPHTPRNRFAMYALAVSRKDIGMTFSAGFGDSGAPNLRLGIAGREDGVSTVTISAYCPALVAGHGARVDALQVCLYRADQRDAELLRYFGIRVTNGTGLRDVFCIDWRARVRRWDKLMNIAVTARASRRFFKTLGARLCVDAFPVSFHSCSVAGIALPRLQFGFVGQRRNIAVTGRALERTMH